MTVCRAFPTSTTEMKKPTWTQQQIDDFREWHIKRLKECGYSGLVLEQLTRDRERYLSSLQPRG
jgi:hypothetical protein